MARALEGVVVVALEQAVAAPYCTLRLADEGARVIKVERAEGDFARSYDDVVHGESAYFVWLNRGKESVVLDFKRPEDATLLHALVARADVFVQNLSPGAAARAGFGSAVLRTQHPRLITCDISGYGEDGPCRRMKAYDLLIQCETGLASITGGPSEPGRVGVSIADLCCGMNAHAAVLQALYARERTGQGRGVAVSLFDGLADWMAVPLLHHDYGGAAPVRVGISHPGIAPYGAFACGDGREVVVAVQNEREWRRFCERVLESADTASDPRFVTNTLRCDNRGALDELILEVFGGLDADALVARLASADIAYGAVNGVADLSIHPQLRRIEVTTATGPVSMPAPPWRWDNDVSSNHAATPSLDAHGGAIRAEFADARVHPQGSGG